MREIQLNIASENYSEFSEYLKLVIDPTSLNVFDCGMQMIRERYSFMNANFFVIIALIINKGTEIKVLLTTAGARSDLLLKLNFGTEKRALMKLVNEIETWCEGNSIVYERISEI